MEKILDKEMLLSEMGKSLKSALPFILGYIYDVVDVNFHYFVDNSLILINPKESIVKDVCFVYDCVKSDLYTCYTASENVKKGYDGKKLSYKYCKESIALFDLGTTISRHMPAE